MSVPSVLTIADAAQPVGPPLRISDIADVSEAAAGTPITAPLAVTDIADMSEVTAGHAVPPEALVAVDPVEPHHEPREVPDEVDAEGVLFSGVYYHRRRIRYSHLP